MEQCISILNIEEKFFSAMQTYLEKSLEHLSADESKKQAKEIYGLKETVGFFRNLGRLVETKLTNNILVTLKLFETNYATLDFDALTNEAVLKGNEIAEYIVLDTPFWITFQEKFMGKYLYCFFMWVFRKGFKLADVAEKPQKHKEIYIEKFSENNSEIFDDVKDLIDGNFATIPLIFSRLKEKYPEIIIIKYILALIKLREDTDKKEKDEMLKYCENKFSTPKDHINDTQSEESSDYSENEAPSEKKDNEEDEGFDISAWQKGGGIEISKENNEEEKNTFSGVQAYLAKEIDGKLKYKGESRHFAILGGKIFCYKRKGDSLADGKTFPTLDLNLIKSVVSKGDMIILKYHDGSIPPIELQTSASDESEKWVACINMNIKGSDSISPSRRMTTAKSLGMDAGVVRLAAIGMQTFNVEKGNGEQKKDKHKKHKIKKHNTSITEHIESKVETQNPVIPIQTEQQESKGFFEKIFGWCKCCHKRPTRAEVIGENLTIN